MRIPILSLLICLALAATGCRTTPSPDALQPLAANEAVQAATLSILALPIAASLYMAGVRPPKGPPILATGSEAEIQAAGVADARADAAKGRPRVCHAGGYAAGPVGVPPEHLYLVKALPKVSLPVGCTAPFARQAVLYAEAYNKEILQHLLHQ